MKSPFAIFRKHQRMLMVVLTGLAMFAFVIADSLRAEHSAIVMPIFFAMLGAVAAAAIGWRSGDATKYAIVGTLIGALVGYFLPQGAPPKAPVETDVGNLSHQDLQALMERRRNANNFLRAAFEKVQPPMTNNQMLAQWWEQQAEQRMFGFFSRDREGLADDVILGFLLDKEADELGIVVSDDAVSDYINRMTMHKLNASDYASILKSLHLSESEVFKDIRGELRAKLAMEVLLPRATPTPEQYWDDYRKLGVNQTMQVAAVPLEDFLAQAPEPSKEKLDEYFNAFKEIEPPFPGAPGLKQPRRVGVEYLEADFAEVEKEVAAKPITDAEVKKYYEEHHEEYRTRPKGSSAPLESILQPGSNLSAPLGTNSGPAGGQGPSIPTGPTVTPPHKGATQGTPAPKAGSPPAKPNSAKPPAGTNDKKGTQLDRPRGRFEGEMLAEAAPERDDVEKPLQLAALLPAGDSKGNGAQPAAPAQTSSRKTREPDAPALPEPKRAGSSAPAKGNVASSTPESAKASASPPEFRPLDEILQREIRDQILRSRTNEAMKTKIQAAYDYMSSLHEQLIPPEPGVPAKMSDADRKRALADYATKHHLKYVQAPPMSAYEFHESAEKYPIAVAAEPVDDPFQQQQRRPIEVIQQLFLSPPDALFQAYLADDRDTHRFAYWKASDQAEHVPTLDEPGIREKAVRAWKMAEFAQKKAKERADELADVVRKSKKSMSEALSGQTVTKKGPAVVVTPTSPFSWYTVQSAAPQGLEQDPRPHLSEIAGVKDPDDAFMKVVFDEMRVGDVRVVPNMGPSVFYVVRVETRHPSNEQELEAFRARFLKENFFGSGFFMGGRSTYDYLNAPPQQFLTNEWAQRLYAKYRVRRNLDEERPSRGRPATAF